MVKKLKTSDRLLHCPLDDGKVVKKKKKVCGIPRLRSSLKPGVICIILAGRYSGKRVVLLKQLEDTIVVTGPFKINGVPLRRVNPSYVIACSGITVDVSSLDLSKFTKEYFSRDSKSKKCLRKAITEEKLFDEKKEKQLDSSRISDQKAIDEPIIKSISQVPNLAKYLSSSFSLNKGDYPHLMKF
ncbi:hypothetical protein T552_00484 [Pneumocystis carinii B80]|uniref:60S ribosomal protein L6 n=1 Tax=Pneumocystis carinii (strain B80) TaxID=1408658 RepID=A0A0W4ZQX4_PNEC8|nr:hypothetical protein T552_00484 [Pneumocystis carinii B80]KTW30772.1 hypothetical protein T552_00484 [Pneumocystis carinii B80]